MPAPKTPAPKQTPLLQEMRGFIQNLPDDLPYDQLIPHARKEGWTWRVRQTGVPVPYSSSMITQNGTVIPAGGLLVTFDVFVGKEGGALEQLDTVTVGVPPNTGAVSLAARVQLQTTLMHLFFDRLPPAPEREAAPAPAPRMAPPSERAINGYDREEAPTESIAETDELPDVVAKRTPDGLPIFVDLYELGDPGPLVGEAVLAEIRDVMPSILSEGGLTALWSENAEAMEFMKDLALPEQRAELKALFAARTEALKGAGEQIPRRRSAPVH